MKHFLSGFLFFYLIFEPVSCLAAIDINISNLNKKEDYYQLTAEVSGMSSSSGTFVQGMFTSIESPKYFGYTLGKKGEWLIYNGSPEKSFVTENFIELKNNEQQTIFLKPNFQDKDYLGPGKYFIKLKRYTASGSPSDYSNSIELDLNFTATTPQPTPISTPAITPNFTSTPTKIITNTVTPMTPPKSPTSIPMTTSNNQKLPTPEISNYPQVLSSSSSVLAEATDTGTIIPESTSLKVSTSESSFSSRFKIISDKNLFLIGASVFVISGILLYFRLKNL